MQHNYLAVSWSVSRGQETYGYDICRLDDRATDKRYRCMGGGYDMVGTVVGHWLQDVYQDRLLSIKDQFTSTYSKTDGYKSSDDNSKLYGGCYNIDSNTVSLDGACGIESMWRIADAIGISYSRSYNRRTKRTEGFFVTDTQEK